MELYNQLKPYIEIDQYEYLEYCCSCDLKFNKGSIKLQETKNPIYKLKIISFGFEKEDWLSEVNKKRLGEYNAIIEAYKTLEYKKKLEQINKRAIERAKYKEEKARQKRIESKTCEKCGGVGAHKVWCPELELNKRLKEYQENRSK